MNAFVFNVVYAKKPTWLVVMTTLSISDFVEVFNYMISFAVIHAFPDSDFATSFLPKHLKGTVTFQSASMTFNRWILVLISGLNFHILRKAKLGLVVRTESLFKKILTMIVGIAVLSTFSSLPRYWEYELKPCKIDAFTASFKPRSSSTACSWPYLRLYDVVFALTLNTVVPCGLIFAANLFIVLKMVVKGTGVERQGGGDAEKRLRSLIRSCSIVSVVYLILQIPYIIMTFKHASERFEMCRFYHCNNNLCLNQECPLPYLSSHTTSATPSSLHVAQTECRDPVCICRFFFDASGHDDSRGLEFWMHLGLILNCSVNFFIYLSMSASFRSVVLNMIRCKPLQPAPSLAKPSIKFSSSFRGPGFTSVRFKSRTSGSVSGFLLFKRLAAVYTSASSIYLIYKQIMRYVKEVSNYVVVTFYLITKIHFFSKDCRQNRDNLTHNVTPLRICNEN